MDPIKSKYGNVSKTDANLNFNFADFTSIDSARLVTSVKKSKKM